jgi:hypothetical protein
MLAGSVCENYCDECKLSSCPCFDLPLKKSGHENCVELKDICDGGSTGRCAWDAIEMPTSSDINMYEHQSYTLCALALVATISLSI